MCHTHRKKRKKKYSHTSRTGHYIRIDDKFELSMHLSAIKHKAYSIHLQDLVLQKRLALRSLEYLNFLAYLPVVHKCLPPPELECRSDVCWAEINRTQKPHFSELVSANLFVSVRRTDRADPEASLRNGLATNGWGGWVSISESLLEDLGKKCNVSSYKKRSQLPVFNLEYYWFLKI